MEQQRRVCVIGAGPCGMAALNQLSQLSSAQQPEVVCYEKQSTWGGIWNFSWLTGTDEHGEPCHAGMYRHLWCNAPKEALELPDYTFHDHYGCPTPSYLPRTGIRDYLIGRWKKSKSDLTKNIKFNTVVRNVHYDENTKKFTIEAESFGENNNTVTKSLAETFDYVIVAVGIFHVPNKPSFEGLDQFEGRVLHVHDMRDAHEFSGQRVLVVGGGYSAEDVTLHCIKFGAKHVTITHRSASMGFKWPPGVDERPLLQKVQGNTVFFKDGSKTEVDAIIMCTGYLYSFPFLETRLRLVSDVSLYPTGLHVGTVWRAAGDGRLLYMGVQNQVFTMPMFDAQARWIARYIVGEINLKTAQEVDREEQEWSSRCAQVRDTHESIDFQAAFVRKLCEEADYGTDMSKAADLFHKWTDDMHRDVLRYRDESFRSLYTGHVATKIAPSWWESLGDESMQKILTGRNGNTGQP